MSAKSLLWRFVDWDLARGTIASAGNASLLIGMSPWLAIFLIQQQAGKPTLTAPAVLAIAFDVAWFAFVGWRGWRLFRQSALRGDRRYDRSGKYLLPPEYADTESATRARGRKKMR